MVTLNVTFVRMSWCVYPCARAHITESQNEDNAFSVVETERGLDFWAQNISMREAIGTFTLTCALTVAVQKVKSDVVHKRFRINFNETILGDVACTHSIANRSGEESVCCVDAAQGVLYLTNDFLCFGSRTAGVSEVVIPLRSVLRTDNEDSKSPSNAANVPFLELTTPNHTHRFEFETGHPTLVDKIRISILYFLLTH
jgi:hypothetical protein